MQVQMLASESIPASGAGRVPGALALALDTVRSSGLRGLWLGQTGTLLRETFGSGAWFTTFELVSRWFRRRRPGANDDLPTQARNDLPTWQLLVSGAAAGMAYNVILFPADSIKSAIQTHAELNPGARRLTFAETGRRIYVARGLKGLYAGCGVTILRSMPSSAMIFGIYSELEKRF